MNSLQQNTVNQTLTLVQNNYHFYVTTNERDIVKEKIEKIQEQFHSIEKDIEIKDYSELDKKFKEIWQAISYLVEYKKLECSDQMQKTENYLNVIKSIYAIIDLYKIHYQNINVNINIINELRGMANDISSKYLVDYSKNKKPVLDEYLWFRHKLYHYLKENGVSILDIYMSKDMLRSCRDKDIPYSYRIVGEMYDKDISYSYIELKEFFCDDRNEKHIWSLIVKAEKVKISLNHVPKKFLFLSLKDGDGFYCFESEQQALAFMMYVEMKKLDELYQSIKGMDINT